MENTFEETNRPLYTPRLTLKRLCESDAELIFALRSNPEVVKFTAVELYDSIGDALKYIGRIARDIDSMICLMWSIRLNDKNIPIGSICLWNYSGDGKKADIGYDLLPEFWGNGYMPEAVKAVIRFGLEKCGFISIEANPRTENLQSQRILEKCGFRRLPEPRAGEDAHLLYEYKKEPEPMGDRVQA